jgi:PPOX class probable FMN-dependent enzyme
MIITTRDELRALYDQPPIRSIKKELPSLDVHSRRFIELSPFLVLATSDRDDNMDASPRGGAPGFVKVSDDGALLIPDAPGNNRLDSLLNIVDSGKVGALFMIPGFDETLRVNGDAVLSQQPDDIARCADERRVPKLVIRVTVTAVYLHCAKAFLRSKLWSPEAHRPRELLPTMGAMLNDQTGVITKPETRDEMVARYAPEL